MVRAPLLSRAESDESRSRSGDALVTDQLFDLTGRVAIVTGTSRGLGQTFARALARAGADLSLTSRHATTLSDCEKEIRQLGRRILSLALDVRDYNSIQKMVSDAEKEFGHIDILVNN